MSRPTVHALIELRFNISHDRVRNNSILPPELTTSCAASRSYDLAAPYKQHTPFLHHTSTACAQTPAVVLPYHRPPYSNGVCSRDFCSSPYCKSLIRPSQIWISWSIADTFSSSPSWTFLRSSNAAFTFPRHTTLDPLSGPSLKVISPQTLLKSSPDGLVFQSS